MKPTKHIQLPKNWVAVRRGLLAAMTIVAAAPVFAQATAQANQATAAQANDEAGEEAIVLSPFTVDATKDKGYFAENTLAGSRMKTNVADLGASISVITKQQLEDTASIDINDVFRYEVNTEGSSTYTPSQQTFRSDGLLDTNAGGNLGNTGQAFTNATSNRVRGLGTPSVAINYYPSVSRLPMDAYNIDRVEVSRGPNSMLFGMGSPAGIVNQGYAQAALNRDRTTVQVRFDDRGSYRGSISFNRGLIDDKLAIFGAAVYNHGKFIRKPSYDITRRQYAAVTYKPFSKTTLRAMVENYNNHNNRPNSVSPRDFVSQWNLAGQPIYDSLTRTVTRTVNGQQVTSGPYVMDTASPFRNTVIQAIERLPNYNPALWNSARTQYNNVNVFGDAALTNTGSALYVPSLFYYNNRPTQQIRGGELVNFFQAPGNLQYLTGWGIPPAANPANYPTKAAIWANPTWADVHNRYYAGVTGWTAQFERPLVGQYKYPSVTDQSIYDWHKVNLLQMNSGKERNATYNIELEQEIFSNLHLTAGWFRQDFDAIDDFYVSQLNATTLLVDVNKYLPDGTPNPFVGKVYVEDQDPDRFRYSEVHDHYRAMLAYTPDFTRQNNWLKWLGRHQILGLWSWQDSKTTSLRQRFQWIGASNDAGRYRFLPNSNNRADGSPTGWRYATGNPVRRTYYLASPSDPSGVVTSASGPWHPERYGANVQVYNYDASRFETIGLISDWVTREDGNGIMASARQLESLSAGMTNYLWEERLITTFGVRQDEVRSRSTSMGQLVRADGVVVGNALTNEQKYQNGFINEPLILNRWDPIWRTEKGTTRTVGGVFRPFRNWDAIDSRANAGSWFWQFVRDFGVSYNKSDNFNPPPRTQVDVFGNVLPKPTGEGEDYGFQFSLFDNKLFARVTWFEATNKNERTNPGASISRLTSLIDTTMFRDGWARTIALINMGFDPRLETFGTGLTSDQERQLERDVAAIWKQDYEYYSTRGGEIFATRDAEAKGVEVSVNYNPTRNWTLKFTGSKQDTFNSNVLKEFDAWFAERNPIWTEARATNHLLPQYQQFVRYTRDSGRNVDLTTFWGSYGYNSDVRDDHPNGQTNVQRYYDNVVTPQYQLARDLNGQRVMGQRRYRWSLLTNYTFDRGMFRGFGVGGSERWEDKAIIGYYGRSSGNDPRPGFLDLSDVSKPIWSKANYYTDVWVSYTRKVYGGKANLKLQLNVENVLENGKLQVVAVNYDGSPWGYRIIDPRRFVFTATLDF
jgi:hypothetical protein